MNRFLIGVFLMVLSWTSMGQGSSVRISGRVVDIQTQIPIPGVSLLLLPKNQGFLTNDEGKFVIPGFHHQDSILLSALGYKPQKIALPDVIEMDGEIALTSEPVRLETLVLTAGITNPLRNISHLDMRLRTVNNAQEILRTVPGLFIGQHAGGGKAEQLFLRGFDVDHGTDVGISVDGMPVNMVSHAHGQGYADMHFIIPETIEDVQYRKGPYETSKGNFITAGWVNLKTKKRIDRNMVKAEGGSFGTFRNAAMINLVQNEKVSWYAAGEMMLTRGYFDNPQRFNRFNFFSSYRQHINEVHTLSISASSFRSRWNASGQVPERAVKNGTISFFGAIDPNEGGFTSRTNVNAELVSQLNASTSIRSRLFYSRYQFDLFSNFTFFLEDSVNGDQIRQYENRDLFGYTGSVHQVRYLNTRKLTLEAGVQLRLDRTHDSKLAQTTNRTAVRRYLQRGGISEFNGAVYVEQTIQWNHVLSMNAGLRYDRFRFGYRDALDNGQVTAGNAGILSPKINLYVHAGPKTEIYLSAGKGFHSNDTRVVLQNAPADALPAAYSTDLGINLKPRANLYAAVAIWRLLLNQEFVYVGDAGIVEAGGKTARYGIDVSLRYQPFKKIFIDADVNLAKARSSESRKGSDFIPLSPPVTASGGITYKTATGFNGGMRFRFLGDRPANEDNTIIAKGYFLSDALIGYIHHQWEVTISAQNLFNVKWKETQFATTSRLRHEAEPVTEIHFTPGSPFALKAGLSFYF